MPPMAFKAQLPKRIREAFGRLLMESRMQSLKITKQKTKAQARETGNVVTVTINGLIEAESSLHTIKN